MALFDIETPTLILDRSALERNTSRMTARFAARGIRLRPHMKTAKSIDVARLAISGNFGGITVSTLREAEYFARHGITDITYAVGIIPQKLGRVIDLVRQGVRVSIITDRVEIAEEASRIAAAEGVVLPTLVELDSGEQRAGVSATSDELCVLGATIEALPGLRLEGVLTHAGHSYQGRSIAQIEEIAEAERVCATTAAERLRSMGLDVGVVSIGSTPTATHGKSYQGITEVRCGVYMFGDVFQSEIRSCRLEDVAVSVLATVVDHRRDLGTALIDAGALALSKDRSTAAAGLPEDIGYGLVLDASASRLVEGVRVGQVYQEHGLLVSEGAFPFDQLPIGTRVRILPNHACMTAAMHQGYHVVDGIDDTSMEYWPRINGW